MKQYLYSHVVVCSFMTILFWGNEFVVKILPFQKICLISLPVLILHCFVLVVGGDDNRNKQTGERGHVTKKVRIKFNNFAFRLPR